MATAFQLGEYARREGLTAEGALREHLRSDLSAAELGAAVRDFLDGYGVKDNPVRKTLFDRCVAEVTKRGSAKDPRAVCAAAGRRKYGAAEMARRSAAGRGKKGGRRNPAEAAAAAYEEFHGHAPTETVEVTRKVHFHKHLSAAGKLVRLDVKGLDGRVHVIRRFEGALLAFNEKKNQLFVEGGDQSVNLADFGITDPHEVETLGKVVAINYHANKTHLGDEGGNAIYRHKFRTTNQDGQHVTVSIARYPDLIYRVLESHMEFSGGSYTIKSEGIDF